MRFTFLLLLITTHSFLIKRDQPGFVLSKLQRVKNQSHKRMLIKDLSGEAEVPCSLDYATKLLHMFY